VPLPLESWGNLNASAKVNRGTACGKRKREKKQSVLAQSLLHSYLGDYCTTAHYGYGKLPVWQGSGQLY
jgi:hypothetical protein